MHYKRWAIIVSLVNILELESSYGISEHPIAVIIAFDGFRYDYLKRGLTPVLEQLILYGSSAEFMINQFPTVTFPNFFSISTGMYPETHGVLGNFMFDKHNNCVTYGYEMFHYNEEIIPIWVSKS